MYFVNLQLLFVKGYVLKHFHGMGGEYILWQCMRKIGAKWRSHKAETIL